MTAVFLRTEAYINAVKLQAFRCVSWEQSPLRRGKLLRMVQGLNALSHSLEDAFLPQ